MANFHMFVPAEAKQKQKPAYFHLHAYNCYVQTTKKTPKLLFLGKNTVIGENRLFFNDKNIAK